MIISRKKAVTACVILAAFGIFFLLKHILVTDEVRIKKVIYRGKTAIEKKDIEGVMEQVSRDYQDDYGLNKFAVMALFQRVFNEFDAIAIHVEDMRVEINEKKQGKAFFLSWATVRTRDQARYLVGNPERPCQVILTLVKEGGKWRVIKADGIAEEVIYL